MNTPAEDLITWLRAQLDDDEQMLRSLDSTALNGIDSTAGWDVRAYVERGRAEVDAKRRILDLHADPHECPEWDRPLGETCTGYYGAEGCPTLRLLAAPHAGRDGYREEWKP